ncbi:MAG: HD domain-containing phosphohydrolase [Planctomycetota bacterium]
MKFVALLLLTQTACIAAGIGLQYFCIRWSASEALLKQTSLTMASGAAALVSALTAGSHSSKTPDDADESRSPSAATPQTDRLTIAALTASEVHESARRFIPAETGLLVADDDWRVRFTVDVPSASAPSLVGEGYRLRWNPRNGDGSPGGNEAFGTFQLPDGAHFAIVKPFPSRDGYLILHQTEAALEQKVSAILGSQASVSLMTLVWTAALLGVGGFLIAGRFYDEVERERSRSLNDALRQRQDLVRTRDAVIVGLAKLAESRDPETGDHLDRISLYATTLATTMMRDPEFMVEVTPSFVRLIGISAALHDIGKVGVEDRILLKPGRLTVAERARMEDHPRIGGDCLREIERRLGRSNFLQMAREVAFSHHERWDGSGYPAGLRGERIPLAARIVAIGDVYDALASRRVYKEPLPHDKCVAIIREGAGTQFDPRIVEIWLTIASRFREIAERYSSSHTQSFDEQVEDEPAPATETCGSLTSTKIQSSECLNVQI